MQPFTHILALVVAVAPFFAQAAPLSTRPSEDIVAGKYLVQLMPDVDVASIASHHQKVRGIKARNLGRRDDAEEDTSIQEYDLGDFKGYAGSFDSATIAELEAMPEVMLVEKDFMMHTFALVSQSNAGWGLGSISSRTRGATSYIYDSTAGQGTHSYVLDSGIRTTHVEFEGRASWGYNSVNTVNTDNFGHGTHVAGIIGAKTYGVAKKTNLIAVKVIGDDGLGTASGVLDGLSWALNDIVTKNRRPTAVINMSLGGPASSVIDNAMTAVSNQGVLAVVAAGNENQLASNVSPARSPTALCVGNINSNDARAPTSNYGSAVDIWAPGTDIVSTWYTSDTATRTESGTSMAAPYVAGIVSYLRALEGPSIGPAARTRVLALATPGRVTDTLGAPNLLAYNGNGR
ncbi:alkaline serine protease alp1 [Stemphylium lycopersici]|uniref:Subtilisin-like protease-like protein n=1 Tax=Stemphylium lycopersici TaxID=183478 RepID=A0A364MRT3_STELY|nr:alkaline serine protease alp1 [Stemphylium lycopersici]RAR01053.1 subtilisin-like protease-like protein [Stemphylium lycopersici]